jgi:hypothetical protein
LYNTAGCDYNVICCDSAGNPTDQFFTNDANQPSKVSIIYYALMSMFIVFINEIVTQFDINIIPFNVFYYIINTITRISIHIKNIICINSKIFDNVELKDFTISSIRKLLKELSSGGFNKLFMTNIELDNNCNENVSDNALNSKVLSKDNKSSNYKHGSSNNISSNISSNSHNGRSRDNNGNRAANVNDSGRINRVNRVDTSNRSNNIAESSEYNNQNNVPSQNNERNSLSNNDLYFNMDDIGSIINESVNNSPVAPMPPTPNAYSNFTTPSTMTPLFRSYNPSINSTNDQPINTSQGENLPGPINSSVSATNNTDNRYTTNTANYSRDFSHLPATTSVPNSSSNTTQFVSLAQGINQPISSQPNPYELAVTGSNQVSNNIGLINNPRPVGTSYVDSNNIN